MKNPKIVLLAGKGISTNIVYHALQKNCTIDAIILEEPVSKKIFLKKRIKKLGIVKVLGQILFQAGIVPFLSLGTTGRRKDIMGQYGLDETALPPEKIIRVSSVNDETCMLQLQRMNPDIIIVNGTRIIAAAVLNCVSSKFINIHAGITPLYRGVHGAYWALVNNDAPHCGVTVHLVDPGIDTGSIVYQKTISVTPKDNFTTYPLLQLAEGIGLLQKALADIGNGQFQLTPTLGPSRLWYHPTMGQYLYQLILKGKK